MVRRDDRCTREVCPFADEINNNSQGVSNFRAFQLDQTRKMAFVHGAAWAWSVILVVIMAAVGWAFREAYPAIRQIMADYYSHHPAAQIHTSDGRPVLAESATTAQNPTLRR